MITTCALPVPLSELKDFKVADGAPDVRGWDVIADGGRKVGEVKELLVSAGSQVESMAPLVRLEPISEEDDAGPVAAGSVSAGTVATSPRTGVVRCGSVRCGSVRAWAVPAGVVRG